MQGRDFFEWHITDLLEDTVPDPRDVFFPRSITLPGFISIDAAFRPVRKRSISADDVRAGFQIRELLFDFAAEFNQRICSDLVASAVVGKCFPVLGFFKASRVVNIVERN